jgi:WD40 repeat protein
VTFSPDDTLIATASDDTTARIWDTTTGQPRTALIGHTSGVNALAFSPDGTLIATASADGTMRLWDVAGASLAVCRTFGDRGYAVLLPDGSYKIGGDPGGELWWALKLARFEPGEIDEYVPSVRRLPEDAPILPPASMRLRPGTSQS